MNFQKWGRFFWLTRYDEYIAMQYVFNKLEGEMTAFKYLRVWYCIVEKAVYIIKLDKAICISLKTVRDVLNV